MSKSQDQAVSLAFQKGQQAWREGKKIELENPYPINSPYHDHWGQGWEKERETHKK